jgi:hypothetical protein
MGSWGNNSFKPQRLKPGLFQSFYGMPEGIP